MSQLKHSVPPGETVTGLDRSLRLVEFLAQSVAPVGVREAAAKLGLDKSSVGRILNTLRSRGWVERDGTGRYRITELPPIRLIGQAPSFTGSPAWPARLESSRGGEGPVEHRQFPELHERIEILLERDGFDGFITVAPETAHYLSSVYNPVRKLIPERPALVLWPRGGEPTLVAGSIEAPLLDGRSSITDIRYYQGDTAVIAREVGRAIQDRGLKRARLGAELAAMPASLYLALVEAVPNLVLADGGSSIGELRAIKSPAETQIMTAASQATDHAERSGLSVFEQGWTEIRLGTVLRQALISAGAETIAFLTLGGSGRGIQAHATPSAAHLHPHDVLRFDMGGMFEGWCTDIAKTACIGEASMDQRRVFADLKQILDNHIGRIKAGARCSDLYEAVAADFNAVGRQLRAPHVGHGIGLAVHEWPLMSADSEATLQAGMILCAELVHVHEGRERYHLEEIVSVHHGSSEVISRSSGDDTEIPVIG